MKLNIAPLKGILFDWDNTLVESRSSLVTAINEVLLSYGLQDWEIEKQKRDPNLSFKDNFIHIFGDRAEEAYNQYREIYLRIMPDKIQLFPYVREVLEFFVEHNVPMFIVSNKERVLLEKEKEYLLSDYIFQNVVCGHEAQYDKPHPIQILYALKDFCSEHEISSEHFWMVGDSPMDSKAAVDAGIQPVRIGRSMWGGAGKPENKIIYFNNLLKTTNFMFSINPNI